MAELNKLQMQVFGRKTNIPLDAFDPDFQNFYDYAVLQGYYLPDNVRLNAANAKVIADKASGYWAANDVYYIFAWNDILCSDISKICLKRLVEMDSFGGVSYLGGGTKGNGTTGYLNTKFNMSSDSSEFKSLDASVSFVIYDLGTPSYYAVGGGSSSFATYLVALPASNIRLNKSIAPSPTIETYEKGFHCFNRTGNNAINYILKSSQQFNTEASGTATKVNQEFYIHRIAGGAFGDKTIASLALGRALTYTESQQFRADFNTYLTKIGLTPLA